MQINGRKSLVLTKLKSMQRKKVYTKIMFENKKAPCGGSIRERTGNLSRGKSAKAWIEVMADAHSRSFLLTKLGTF